MTRRIRHGVCALLGGAAVAATLGSAGDLGRRAPFHAGMRSSSIVLGTGRPAPVAAATAPATDGPAAQDPRLLAARELPLLVPGTDAWQESVTYTGRGTASDVPCLLRPVDALGALSRTYRTYRQATHPGGKFNFYYAAELLADFPSPTAAAAAAAQVNTWIGQCSQDGFLPGATVTSRGPGQWSVTSATVGPDRNTKLPPGSRAEAEFVVQQKGNTVSVLHVGAETASDVPWDRMRQAAASAVAKL